jgi:hypothetical protein
VRKNEEVKVMQLNRLDKRERGMILGFLLSRRLGFYIYIYIFFLLNFINTIFLFN